jgi:hypothetical protein
MLTVFIELSSIRFGDTLFTVSVIINCGQTNRWRKVYICVFKSFYSEQARKGRKKVHGHTLPWCDYVDELKNFYLTIYQL